MHVAEEGFLHDGSASDFHLITADSTTSTDIDDTYLIPEKPVKLAQNLPFQVQKFHKALFKSAYACFGSYNGLK